MMRSELYLAGCISMCAAMVLRVDADPAPLMERKDLDVLLAKADEWGLPQPAADSQLVKVWVFRSNDQDCYALGFREREHPDTVLVGFSSWRLNQGTEVVVVSDARNLPLDDIASTSPFAGVFGVNFGLATGLQLLRTDHPELGSGLIAKSLQAHSGHRYSNFRSPAGETPIVMLARSCLAHAMNQISSEKPDFPAIKARIELILKDQPQIRSEAADSMLEALEATINWQPAPEGSIDSIIDDYLMSGRAEGALTTTRGQFGEAERKLILQGFDAVPALINRFGSKCITNHVMEGFNNFSSYPMNVGQVVNAYLQRLANDDLGSNWLDRQKGYVSDKDAVQAWWKEASKSGEKCYVESHVLVKKDKGRYALSAELLLIAVERYPELLPGVYRRILRTGELSWPVAKALMAGKVENPERIKLFEEAIATNRPEHRNSALARLQEIDAAAADRHLLRLLKQAPRTAKDEYWTDQNATISFLVSRSSDSGVWKALDDLIVRADLGMQMELINHMHPSVGASRVVLDRFYGIYDRYSKDVRIRDESSNKKFDGPGAGFPYKRLEMRDFIHIHWARWLGLEIKVPENGEAADEWQAYRDTVSKAVEVARAKLDESSAPDG